MGAVNYIDWTANDGVFNIDNDYESYYVCDKIITLSDDYYYYESDVTNRWEYDPFAILDDSLLNNTTDPNIVWNDFLKHSIYISANQKTYIAPIIGYIVNSADTSLVTSGYAFYRIGIFFNKYKVGCIVPNHEVLVADIPNTFDTDTDKRIFAFHYHNNYGAYTPIYTSDPNFTLKQNLVDAGYTNIVPLFDYLKGTYTPGGGGSSGTNKVNILKIY